MPFGDAKGTRRLRAQPPARWGAAGPGAAQPQNTPTPHPPCGTLRPMHLQTTGLPFSLVTLHPGTPFNFSYPGLTFGIFTVRIISTYFLPYLVV